MFFFLQINQDQLGKRTFLSFIDASNVNVINKLFFFLSLKKKPARYNKHVYFENK